MNSIVPPGSGPKAVNSSGMAIICSITPETSQNRVFQRAENGKLYTIATPPCLQCARLAAGSTVRQALRSSQQKILKYANPGLGKLGTWQILSEFHFSDASTASREILYNNDCRRLPTPRSDCRCQRHVASHRGTSGTTEIGHSLSLDCITMYYTIDFKIFWRRQFLTY